MRQKSKRNCKGGTGIAELGPALFVLIIVILIPMMDMLYLMMSYAAGWMLNHQTTREVSVKDPTDGTQIKLGVQIADMAWRKTLFCGLAQATGSIAQEQVTFVDASNNPYVSNFSVDGSSNVSGTATTAPSRTTQPVNTALNVVTVQVVTQLPVKPLFVVPLVNNCPGLSAPVIFSYSGQRPQEEKGLK
ncbi:MAG TPA: hypothetical protein V6C97_14040 [Oculatellaceae cyanobacterium]